MRDHRPAVVALLGLALTGCSGGLGGLGLGSGSAPPAPAAAPTANMAGRWLLASPGRGQCHMTFAGEPASAEGTIRPEGGCPGKFFTSRKWTYEGGSLVMRDHNGQPLGQFSESGGHFNGQSTTGEPVTLSR